MITVGIDESGNFESKEEPLMFIGGFVFTGDNYDEEMKSLEGFFIKQCKELNIDYPFDIHTTKMKDFRLKQNIEKRIKDYLKSNGKYKLICMVKSRRPKKDYINISNIVDDNNASNLYEHMVCQLINNIILNILDFTDSKSINFDIATRIAMTKDPSQAQEYEKLGYSRKPEEKDDYIFYLTDQKTYKTAISTSMTNLKVKENLEFQLNVKSTNYRSKEKTTPYLYIADFCCDIIRGFFNKNEKDFDIENCKKRIKNFTGMTPMLWVYDDIDEIYNNILYEYYKKDFINCLNGIYELEHSDSEFTKFYVNSWCKDIKRNIIQIFNPHKIGIYIDEIEFNFSKNNPEYDYNKGLKLSLLLKDVCEKYEKDNECNIPNIYKYKIVDMIIRGYNHIGGCRDNRKYFKVCERYKNEVDVDEYINTVLRAVEIDANEFDFDGAIEKLTGPIVCLDEWKNTKEEICDCLHLEKKKSTCIKIKRKGFKLIRAILCV